MSLYPARSDVFAAIVDATKGAVAGTSTTMGATVFRSTKGWPNIVHRITGDRLQTVFGSPIRGSRPYYDLWAFLQKAEAAHVVRVVASDAKYPSITVSSGGAVTSSHSFTSQVTPASKELSLWVKDGSDGAYYSIEITDIDTTAKTFSLNVYSNESGTALQVESHYVSLDQDMRTADGESLYIESVLLSSNLIDALPASDCTINDIVAVSATAFAGGTIGSTPTTSDYTAAWEKINASGIEANLLFDSTDDTAVIAAANQVAINKLGHLFVDIPPTIGVGSLTPVADAVTWAKTTLGISSANLSVYFNAFKCYDPFFESTMTMGVAGIAAGAAALGDFTRGIHVTPAGLTRGKVDQFTQISLLHDLTDADLNALASDWINPVKPAAGTGVVIWDAFTRNAQRGSKLNKINVIRTANYINRVLSESFQTELHEPTTSSVKERIERKVKSLLDPLVTVGALVNTKDGGAPYDLEIFEHQTESDVWVVRPLVCIVGSLRRIALEIVLVR